MKWIVRIAIFILTGIVGFYLAFALPYPSEIKGAYTIDSSLRFNDDDSAYLSRSLGVSGDTTTWTWAGWVKRTEINDGTAQILFSAGTTNPTNPYTISSIGFDSTDHLYYYQFSNAVGFTVDVHSTQVFRDPSAWIHVVVSFDAGASSLKFYVDGVEILDSSSFSTTYRTINNSSYTHRIQANADQTQTYTHDGYLSDVYFIDGQALEPTSFGTFDSYGYWRPEAYGGSYGTNGFHLDFANSSDLGNDVSGNNNDWTPTNLDSTDWVIDTPTNNYATLMSTALLSGGVLYQGNLSTQSAASAYRASYISIKPETKMYLEVYPEASDQLFSLGLRDISNSNFSTENGCINTYRYCILNNGAGVRVTRHNNSDTNSRTADTAWDVMQMAYDPDTGKLWFGRNNTWYGGGSPSAGTSPTYTISNPDQEWVVDISGGNSTSQEIFVAAGQSPNPTSTATTLSYHANAGGYFYYTPPTDFKALSTDNLPKTNIVRPSDYFDAITYTGTTSETIGDVQTIYLTSGTTWSVPVDWNSASNTIEVIGGGGGGANGYNQPNSGGGGGYSKISNASLTPETTVTYAIGAGGSGGISAESVQVGQDGGDTYFCNTTSNCASISGTAVIVGAKGGAGGVGAGTSGGQGGQAASGIGSTTYSGGNGGTTNSFDNESTSGAGGAAGPSGGGSNGGNAGTGNGAAGGGAANAGGAGSNASGADGGNGGGAGGGAGGTSSSRPGGAGSNGGGGGGAWGANNSSGGNPGGAGGDGTEWDATHGAGGGGGGGSSWRNGGSNFGGDGGLYGGGGAGGGGWWSSTPGAGGDGAQGIIVITYTPSGNAIDTLSFQPNLVWLKDRGATNGHGLFDTIRGATDLLVSNTTAATSTDTDSLLSFSTNGFTLGGDTKFNTSNNNYISWNWKEDPVSGFDIVAYTGNGANRTIAHNLNATPTMIVTKDLEGANDWAVYHRANTSAPETDYLRINSTAISADDNTYWNDTLPTPTVFSLGTNADVNTNTNDYIAYLFSEKDGYSRFGSYIGNGSSDGPFVYTGFKPKFVMVKKIDTSTGRWIIWDKGRSPFNVVSAALDAGSTDTEATLAGDDVDLLSNGFKIRRNSSNFNSSGATYIYSAFAETPFKYQSINAILDQDGSTFLMGIPF